MQGRLRWSWYNVQCIHAYPKLNYQILIICELHWTRFVIYHEFYCNLTRWRPSCKVVCIRIRLIRHCGYYLFRSSILCSFYLRAAFILLSQSLRWCRREQSSIEWLLYRQENLLVVADWFTSLFWVGFVSSRWVFVSAHATQVFVTPTAATINSRVVFILFSTRGGAATVREWLLIESGIWSSGYSSLTSCYSLFLGAHSYAIANVRSALRL